MSKTQRIEEKVTIHYEKGIHVRVAATIVQKADRLQNEYNVLYSVHREGLHNVPLTSILLVTALKVKKGEDLLSDRRRAGRRSIERDEAVLRG